MSNKVKVEFCEPEPKKPDVVITMPYKTAQVLQRILQSNTTTGSEELMELHRAIKVVSIPPCDRKFAGRIETR